jgi:hypothetical protein
MNFLNFGHQNIYRVRMQQKTWFLFRIQSINVRNSVGANKKLNVRR